MRHILILAALLSVTVSGCDSIDVFKPDPKVGEVWEYCSGDPFEKDCGYQKVVAVKDGWVQYVYVDSPDGDCEQCLKWQHSFSFFKVGAKRVR